MAVLALGALLPLSGCFEAQAGMTITGDDRVNGTVRVTPSESARSQFAQWKAPAEFGDRVTVRTLDSQSGRMEISFSELRFNEVSDTVRALSDDSIAIDIDRTSGDQISVNGSVDLRRMPDAKVDLLVTFPEEVTNSNGRSSAPNQVEWQFSAGEKHSMWASSPAGATKFNQFLIFTAVVVAVGVLASALGALWARRIRDMQEL
nr:DUF3153 domain-containing protein [Corynebacterium lactis]